ncbi:MAG: 50S ribosomal protein L23 [Candidatus Hydrogenedentota bacterium]|nr:MAG: 50S ribosomal protein L23 [Candidatus Hydrogenedentota bacterium]
MKSAFDVIRYPVTTEKARRGWTQESPGRLYTFEVDPRANKSAIKSAIERAFGVRVKQVRTMVRKGKFRRRLGFRGGNRGGYTATRKRAIVTLAPGEKIAFFDGI